MVGCNVLLVDDEEEFVSALSERLSLRGIETRIATNGEDALARIEEQRPDVVVLDLMMPGMGGHAVLGHIQSNYPNIRVILVTGMGATRDDMEGIKSGAFDCLMKPVEIDNLLRTIGAALQANVCEGV